MLGTDAMSSRAASSSPTSPVQPVRGTVAVADGCWTVRLLGAIEASRDGLTIERWPTRAVASLLARLALAPDRAHPREELIELLWPGVAIEVGRNRLRQALSTLKTLLEPPARAAPVLRADRTTIRVLPGMIDCDVRQFAALRRSGDHELARALYRGELMPGFFDDWVVEERHDLTALFDQLDGVSLQGLPRVAPECATPFGAAASPEAFGLPSYWTRTFGIELPTSRLRALVQAQRLVTVHGPGGSGKTRMAVAAARALCEVPTVDANAGKILWRFDFIGFVPLVGCVSAAQALDAIRGKLPFDGRGDAHAGIVAALQGRRALLVLDNLEQLVEETSRQIAELLTALPGLHVLVTSRRLLRLDGEVAFEIEGLTLPVPDVALLEVAANPAVALFVDRARAVRADFELDAHHLEAVLTLVRMLSGMPLAIELAASRMRGMTPQELLKRLSDAAGTPMLDLLVRAAPHTAADTRHASMRHMVAWSWQQLTAPQQQMLLALSVFAAPARVDAVAAVAATDLHTAQWLLDELMAASLAQPADDTHGTMRFALLQPVREFAAARMPATAAREARGRLRRWLITFARQVLPRGLATVADEVAHVHASIISAPADGDSNTGLELAVALRPFWESDSPPLSGLLALEQALGDADANDETLLVDALELLAYGRSAAGFAAAAVAHAEAGLALAQDDRRRSIALVRWVRSMYSAGRYADTLDTALAEAYALACRADDPAAQASALRMQALMACNFRLDYAGAEALGAQAQRLWEGLGNRAMVFDSLLVRATMWAWLGRNDQALSAFGECERAAIAASDWVSMMTVTRQTGRVYIRMRRWDDAAAAFRRSVRVGWQRHSTQGLAHGLLHLPEALVMRGEAEVAARLHGFAVANWSRHYHAINRIEARELRRTRLLLRLALGAECAEALRAEGTSLGVAEAFRLALGDDVA